MLAALKETTECKVKDVLLVVGIPDYDKVFSQIMADIKGIKN